MRVSLAMLVAVFSLVYLAGCAQPSSDMITRYNLGPAGPVVTAVVENSGGLNKLKAINTIQTTAVVSVYRKGTPYSTAQAMVIRPNAGMITSTADLPEGSWSATVYLDGRSRITTTGSLQLSSLQRYEITDYLRLILHRVRGVTNLLGGGETAGEAADVFVGTYRTTRVLSTGRGVLASAYFFDTDASELRMVTTGGYTPASAGTVTVYNNRRMPDGVILPASLHVSKIGSNTLVGEGTLLEIEFKDVVVK